KDDQKQARRAVSLIREASERGERMFLGHIVLCEITWVLIAGYSLPKKDVIEVLSQLLRTAQFEVEAADLASRALSRYEHGAADFADYLIAERAATSGYDQVATFDRKLLREAGFVKP
ncbi:MAG: putative nucleic-acid-binding protein, partial [Myxococcota bacterium]